MLLDQEFAQVPVEDLSPHPDNPRRGNVEVISESIDAHGFFGACVVQRSTGHILIGNHRWLAAKALGQPAVPVLYVDVNDERAKRILIADNRTAELAGWDDQALHAMLSDLADTDEGLSGLAFTDADMEAMLSDGQRSDGTVLDAMDVSIGKPKHEVEPGQIWRLEQHTLIIASVMTGWATWAPYLAPGAVLVPHPSPFAPLSQAADEADLVMVQPELFVAAHMLDKWAAVKGEPVLVAS